MTNIAIIDYGASNLDSIKRAVSMHGYRKAVITNEEKIIKSASHIILPGVGSFQAAMDNLSTLGLIEVLRQEAIEHKIPFLGICLGMHLLADKGEEGGVRDGLGLIPGVVKKLKTDKAHRLPHIGWNEAYLKKENPIFDVSMSGRDFYFVHSYFFQCKDESNIVAFTDYSTTFPSIVQKENIFGLQFHPEKSQKLGLKIIDNFLKL